MIIHYEVEGSKELLGADLVAIHEAEVSVLVWVYGVNLRVLVLGEGTRFIACKPPREEAYLI